RTNALLEQKLTRLASVDAELRDLQSILDDRRSTVLREPGIGGTCPLCGELHGSDARFCWACGTPVAPGAVRPVISTGTLPALATPLATVAALLRTAAGALTSASQQTPAAADQAAQATPQPTATPAAPAAPAAPAPTASPSAEPTASASPVPPPPANAPTP